MRQGWPRPVWLLFRFDSGLHRFFKVESCPDYKLKHMESSNDFSKFLLFVKGVLESGWVIKRSGKKLNNEAKMHFNRLLNEATQFEKYIHKEVGPEIASLEDDINSDIIHFVWKLFDLPAKERDEFFEYINKFEDTPERRV